MASAKESERFRVLKEVILNYEGWQEKLYGQRNIGKWQGYITRDRKRLNFREIWQVAGKDSNSVKISKKVYNIARSLKCKFRNK